MADEIVEMVPMDKCGVFTGKSIEDAKRKDDIGKAKRYLAELEAAAELQQRRGCLHNIVDIAQYLVSCRRLCIGKSFLARAFFPVGRIYRHYVEVFTGYALRVFKVAKHRLYSV